jgi:hypothetical protein
MEQICLAISHRYAVYIFIILQISARQHGEVVLPYAASGQGPGTPHQRGQKIVMVQSLFCWQLRVSGFKCKTNLYGQPGKE